MISLYFIHWDIQFTGMISNDKMDRINQFTICASHILSCCAALKANTTEDDPSSIIHATSPKGYVPVKYSEQTEI